MAWTNIIAALALGSLGVYFVREAADLARDEAQAFHMGDRYVSWRLWSHRAGGAFLLALALASFVASF